MIRQKRGMGERNFPARGAQHKSGSSAGARSKKWLDSHTPGKSRLKGGCGQDWPPHTAGHTKAVRLVRETAMVLRIRFGTGPKVGKKPRRNQRLPPGFSTLLTTAAAFNAVPGPWRL